MDIPRKTSRRTVLRLRVAGLLGISAPPYLWAADDSKSIAAIVTEYRPTPTPTSWSAKSSKAGSRMAGRAGPEAGFDVCRSVPRAADLARPMAKKHNVPIFDTIEKARDGRAADRIAVDGVISIGEHGNYPRTTRDKTSTRGGVSSRRSPPRFEKYDGRPGLQRQALGPVWDDAKWMYDRARELKVPFMAGSSLPVTFRDPDLTVPDG